MQTHSRRLFYGVVASVLLLTTPALANAAQPHKHRATVSRRASQQLTTADLNDRELARVDPQAAARLEPQADAAPANKPEKVEAGVASWYGGHFNGRACADGSRFNQHALTAAHRWLPLGTRVRVTLAGTNRSVDVTITDRPGTKTRVIDLSKGAARELGIVNQGTAEVIISRL